MKVVTSAVQHPNLCRHATPISVTQSMEYTSSKQSQICDIQK